MKYSVLAKYSDLTKHSYFDEVFCNDKYSEMINILLCQSILIWQSFMKWKMLWYDKVFWYKKKEFWDCLELTNFMKNGNLASIMGVRFVIWVNSRVPEIITVVQHRNDSNPGKWNIQNFLHNKKTNPDKACWHFKIKLKGSLSIMQKNSRNENKKLSENSYNIVNTVERKFSKERKKK